MRNPCRNASHEGSMRLGTPLPKAFALRFDLAARNAWQTHLEAAQLRNKGRSCGISGMFPNF